MSDPKLCPWCGWVHPGSSLKLPGRAYAPSYGDCIAALGENLKVVAALATNPSPTSDQRSKLLVHLCRAMGAPELPEKP